MSTDSGYGMVINNMMCNLKLSSTAADNIQNYRSMVLHILSQLEVGMDLTRVSDSKLMEFSIYL